MMNENSRLSPSRIISQSDAAIRTLEADNEHLRESIMAIDQFTNDDTVNTGGIRNLKSKMEDYRTAVNGFIKANDADIQDHRKLQHLVGTLELNGETIRRNQEERRATIYHIEGRLQHYRGINFSIWQRLFMSDWVAREQIRIRNLISSYEDRLQNAQAALAIWEEREQMYNEIEQATKELFTIGREMRAKAKLGIGHIRAATAGLPNSFQSHALTSWRSNIQVKKETTTTRKEQSQEVLEELEAETALIYGRFRISDEIIFPLWDSSIYNNDFPFDPGAIATEDDHRAWRQWGLFATGASTPRWSRSWLSNFDSLPDRIQNAVGEELSDGAAAFNHFRNGNGANLFLNLQNAYEQDENMRYNFHSEIREMQGAVEALRGQTGLGEFNVSSGTRLNPEYPDTMNWQKAIGGFQMWSNAEVRHINGEYHMTITVRTLDRYNFNDGQQSIGTGVPDSENGRFEQLGWAHSFNSFGEITFEVSWQEGERVNDLNLPILQNGGGR